MIGLLEQILKFAGSGLTVKKAFSGLLLVLFFLGGLFAFENYTGTWRLARLEKATAILERLQAIEHAGDLPEGLEESFVKASEQLKEFLIEAESEVTPSAPKLASKEKPSQLTKFLSGSAIWFLFIIPFLFMAFKKQKGAWPGVIAMLFVGFFFGGINAIIPNIYAPWVNLALIPFMTFMALAGIPIMIPAMAKVRETSQRKTIINNLRQLASAADQYFLKKGESLVSVEALIGEQAYIKKFEVVAGETYPERISTGQKEIVAVLPSGESVSIPF